MLDEYEVPTTYGDFVSDAAFDHVPLIATYFEELVRDKSLAEQFLANRIREQNRLRVFEAVKELVYAEAKFPTHYTDSPWESPRPTRKILDLDADTDEKQSMIPVELSKPVRSPTEFKFIAGVVSPGMRSSLERQVFLISRGNAIVVGEDDIIVVFFIGDVLEGKFTRVCNAMGIEIFCSDKDTAFLDRMILDSHALESELRMTENLTNRKIIAALTQVAENIESWTSSLSRAKGVYDCLNQCNYNSYSNIIRVEGWFPTSDEIQIRDLIANALHFRGYGDSNGPAVVEVLPPSSTYVTPPTFFRTNKFTNMFQSIVDTYGVPRYQEANPGLFTIVTFPFLYGMMYGDVFHASFLFVFAIYLCLRESSLEKQQLNDLMKACFDGRYVLLLMGFFALYCGFIYNDCGSIPIPLFSSGWNIHEGQAGHNDLSSVYPFGIDYAWLISKEKLGYANSLKMKLSIIVGVTQMVFGICLSLANHIHAKDYLAVICDFVPQILFMVAFFGYMVFVIIYKWIVDWCPITYPEPQCIDPPNLIATMIGVFLSPGTVESADQLYDGQAGVQMILLGIVGICIPWMLILKPSVILIRKSWLSKHSVHQNNESDLQMQEPLLSSEEEPEYGMKESHTEDSTADMIVHQIIHTIEFVLGSVSNTASYLRLWALSLAHAQLAEVFFQRLVIGMAGMPYYVGVYIGFSAFLGISLFVLCCMDVLECFLHALRLHWVEFQNKFYHGDGVAFTPFIYKGISK